MMSVTKFGCFFTPFRACVGVLLALGMVLPASAYQGTGGSTQEVWMRYGGARLQYNALVRPLQMYSGGAAFSDPAALPLLRPLKPWIAQQRKRAARPSAKNAPASPGGVQGVSAKAGKSAALTPVPMPAATPAPSVGAVAPSPSGTPDVVAPIVSTSPPMAVPRVPLAPKP